MMDVIDSFAKTQNVVELYNAFASDNTQEAIGAAYVVAAEIRGERISYMYDPPPFKVTPVLVRAAIIACTKAKLLEKSSSWEAEDYAEWLNGVDSIIKILKEWLNEPK